MEKIINFENLHSFAYTNDHICTKPIKGIVIYFFGLNWNQMVTEDMPEASIYGKEGILYVVPYNRPWAWMNKQSIDYTDEILDVIFDHYELPENTPIVSTGMSMGGQGCIVYAKYSKRTPTACVANCPVCDMVYHLTERDDLPRTMYGAYWNEPGTLQEALERNSPMHLIPSLPKISYHIFHCEEDLSVNIDLHSKKFVAAMNEHGHSITLDTVPGRGHVDLSEEAKAKFAAYCIKEING